MRLPRSPRKSSVKLKVFPISFDRAFWLKVSPGSRIYAPKVGLNYITRYDQLSWGTEEARRATVIPREGAEKGRGGERYTTLTVSLLAKGSEPPNKFFVTVIRGKRNRYTANRTGIGWPPKSVGGNISCNGGATFEYRSFTDRYTRKHEGNVGLYRHSCQLQP